MIKTIIYIAIGGGVGSILRYFISVFVNKHWSNHFPLATFITNILGCFLIGLFIGFIEKYNILNTSFKLLLITGFCGGFTTFSTFSYESSVLFQSQNSIIAVCYIFLSIIFGLFAIYLGQFFGST